ncbi:MAG TPA: hypothetical protein VHG69_03415, partial [Thermoleophilaceae bacterium]|nr:hypothetical protein [Thermoleophilaceae bacterium]
MDAAQGCFIAGTVVLMAAGVHQARDSLDQHLLDAVDLQPYRMVLARELDPQRHYDASDVATA